MPMDYSHPTTIRVLKESYDKENEQRISWFIKNKEECFKAATLTDRHKGYTVNDVLRKSLELSMPSLSVHHSISAVNRLKILETVLIVPVPEEITVQSTMKPVEPEISKILHGDDIKRSAKYLHKRNEKSPEDKYNFCQTSNNVYGWGFKESELVDKTVYRRCFTMKRSIHCRSGPQPDPDYYKSPDHSLKCDILT